MWFPHGMQAGVNEYENDTWQILKGFYFFIFYFFGARIESPLWCLLSFLAKCEISYSFKFALPFKCNL